MPLVGQLLTDCQTNIRSVLRDLRYADQVSSQVASRLLQISYPGLVRQSIAPNLINEHEWRFYSQNGEDGILVRIFSQVEMQAGDFVEFGIGDGRECNSANLSINFGWHRSIDGGELGASPGRAPLLRVTARSGSRDSHNPEPTCDR